MQLSLPKGIQSNFKGYNELIYLFNKASESKDNDIVLSFNKIEWFEGNLSAVLGAILDNLNKSIILTNIPNNIQKIFKKNRFSEFFDVDSRPDKYQTTIEYNKFCVNEIDKFIIYIRTELFSKGILPKMSEQLERKIQENIFEIFNNAREHGKSKEIYSCGQYFPKYSRLDFTIVDLGVTIKKNVNDTINKHFSGIDAIEWAVKEGNTTKKGSIPGGLGFSLICEFLKINNGKIQIISSNGFWEQKGQNIERKILDNSYPGTIVNLEFNIMDSNIYYLKSEVKDMEIF